MTDRNIRRVAIIVLWLLFACSTALGAATRSIPWIIIGVWLGITSVIELVRKDKQW